MSTSLACVDCPIVIQDMNFPVNLGCLPLSQIDVILGMNWLSANHILMGCHSKTVVFELNQPLRCDDSRLLSANQVCTSLKQGAHVYLMLGSLEGETGSELLDIPVVCGFP